MMDTTTGQDLIYGQMSIKGRHVVYLQGYRILESNSPHMEGIDARLF